MTRRIAALLLLVALVSSATTAAIYQGTSRDADVKAIRHEIERIFFGFINKDPQELRDTHHQNWRGYLTGSRSVIKGLDGYMAASVGPGGMGPKGQGMTSFKIHEYDTVFYGDTAVVSFVAESFYRNGDRDGSTKMTLIDVYVKENGKWIQAASQTSTHPDSQAARMSELRQLGEEEKASLLESREAVWRAWFGGDEAALRKLLPPELITLGEGDDFGTFQPTLQSSLAFAKSGGKLRSISFPRTEFQAYGATVIIYTTYALETEHEGKVNKEQGKATEVFVRRGNDWLNTGWQLDPDR